jgi:hypothetical protein
MGSEGVVNVELVGGRGETGPDMVGDGRMGADGTRAVPGAGNAFVTGIW